MTPNDLDRLALRGEQLTRLLIEESANAYREVGDLGPLAWALANLADRRGFWATSAVRGSISSRVFFCRANSG